jgi:hypothetical protein
MGMKSRQHLAIALCAVLACCGLQVPSASADEADEAMHIATGAEMDAKRHDVLIRLLEDADAPLNGEQLSRLKALFVADGWPTVATAGRDGVDAAGELLLRASNDADFQEQVLDLIDPQVGVDVNPFAYAHLSDQIRLQATGKQRYGTLLGIDDGKVVASPALTASAGLQFFRDFYGLPLLEEQIAEVQRKVDAGMDLASANPFPRLSQDAKPYTEPELRQELGRMIERDQTARHEAIQAEGEQRKALMERVREADEANLGKIKAIFARVGFPTMEMVGRDGVSTAFLLVQHADDDPAFQKQALELARPLMERREMSRQQFALLTDRVLLADGKQQLYGTQAEIVDGKAVPRPVSHPEGLDARRKAMAMGPEADYLEVIEQRYLHKAPKD